MTWSLRTVAAVPLAVALLLSACASDDERMGHTVCADDPSLLDCAGDRTEPDDALPTLEADCGGTQDAMFPDVVAGEVSDAGDGTFTATATLCSAYDTPERYADAWRVTTLDGDVLAVRELTHDHADEQPFTRSLADSFSLPPGTTQLRIEARDRENGWGGATLVIDVGEPAVD